MALASARPNLAGTTEELQALCGFATWFLILGILQLALGTFVVGWSCLSTVTEVATWIFGIMLLAAGITEVVSALGGGRSGSMVLHLLLGLMYAVVGVMLVDNPERGAVQLTLIIAVFLIVGGLFRIAFALVHRIPGSMWVLLNGVVTLLLGLMIYKQWPESSLWVIGLFVGIELIFNGWAWIMLSILVRKVTAA